MSHIKIKRKYINDTETNNKENSKHTLFKPINNTR